MWKQMQEMEAKFKQLQDGYQYQQRYCDNGESQKPAEQLKEKRSADLLAVANATTAKVGIRICPACGAEVPDEEISCSECGTKM